MIVGSAVAGAVKGVAKAASETLAAWFRWVVTRFEKRTREGALETWIKIERKKTHEHDPKKAADALRRRAAEFVRDDDG